MADMTLYWLRVPGEPAMRATIEADSDDAAYVAALDLLCEYRWWAERGARRVLLTKNNVRVAEIDLDPVD
jgi:hypothetical protein